MKRIARVIAMVAGLAALAQAPALHAQDGADAEKVKRTVDGTVGIEKKTQSLQDDWAAERADLTARYRSARANVEYLSAQKEIMESEASALEAAVAELERRLEESDRLHESLQDTLNVVVQQLETFVTERDLPFLMDERVARIESLKGEMAKPDVTGAEKLRRVLEALQVEANYGGTVELYQDGVDVGGERIFVDVMRVGRVSMFWRTPDGSRIGEYDRAAGAWVELPARSRHNIEVAMEMASRMRPVEIITLPLGRIVP